MLKIELSNKKNNLNILFLIISIILYFTAFTMQQVFPIGGILITEYLLLIFPIIFFYKYFDYTLDVEKSVKTLFNKLRFNDLIEVSLIILLIYPLLFTLQILLGINGGSNNSIGVIASPYYALLLFFTLVITPSICEEIAFRLVLFTELKEDGNIPAILMSSLMFALFHRRFEVFLNTFILGIILGYIYYKNKNILLSIWGHLLFNLIGFIAKYVIFNDKTVETLKLIKNSELLILILVWISVLFVSCYLLYRTFPAIKYLLRKEIYVEINKSFKKIDLKNYWPCGLTIIIYIIVNIFKI